ncbi:MAG TPA: PEP-CTERM sorting domain-containing protein [Candidatus Binatia bacterium]|nr:PEP-CTERM sorting domain-containing protein [Candidatus Binatia bacterium]
MLRRSLLASGFLFALLCAAPFASANSFDLLTFQGLKPGAPVANFYNGGSGVANTPNFGITFSSNVFAMPVLSTITPPPNSMPGIYFNSGTSAYMNVASGFQNGINFFYTATAVEVVTIWSGTSGTGTALATFVLSPNDSGCAGNGYCNWTSIGISFSGTAQSVTFTGTANQLGLADMAVGQSKSVLPEPNSMILLATGMAGVFGQRLRRFIKG